MSKLVAENDIKDESWLDLPGGVKIEEKPDAHWNSASLFVLHKEDHTIANLLRMKLHCNKLVRFAGYKQPHPTVSDIELTVQTAPIHNTSGVGVIGTDSAAGAGTSKSGGAGSVPTPSEAVQLAIDDVLADIDQFSKLWESNVAPHCEKQQ